MTKLGKWTKFINESEMYSWYKLPESTLAECRSYQPDGREMEPLSPKAYEALHKKAVAYARRSVAPFNPLYHNDERHFAITEAYGLDAADAYAGRDNSKMPPFVRQVFGIALRTHDAHHCASTLRIDAPRGLYRPELGRRVSTEWVTALSINNFMRREGLPLPARLFQTGVIWSSTYGGGSPKGKQLGIPVPKPATIWGAIMRAADTCPTSSIEDQLRQTIAVNYSEVPAVPPAKAMGAFVAGELGFMSYIEHTFDSLDQIAKAPLSKRLGWRSRLAVVRQGLDRLQKGDRRLIAFVHNETRRYGVTLS